MTYTQLQSYVPTQTAYSSNQVFQPGFANSAYGTQVPVNTYGAGIGSIFQPGFAGTNVAEVRALNAGYPAPAVAGALYSQAVPVPYQAQVLPSPLQAQVPQFPSRPATLGVGYSAPVSAVLQPGFAGTNVQEVRALNAGYPAPAIAGQFGYATPITQTIPQTAITQTPVLGTPVNAIFQPGFAGTNVQEVHRDWALSQQVGSAIPYGVPTPYRTY